MTAGPRRSIAFGAGRVELDEHGAVAAVLHPSRGHSMLLDDASGAPEAAMHDPSRYWGSGFVITDRGSHRFGAQTGPLHRMDGLELRVDRRIDDVWTESYELRNTADGPVTVGSVAISTPWRDLYSSSRDSLRRAVHAHVRTGGADAWVWAVPMDGSGPGSACSSRRGSGGPTRWSRASPAPAATRAATSTCTSPTMPAPRTRWAGNPRSCWYPAAATAGRGSSGGTPT